MTQQTKVGTTYRRGGGLMLAGSLLVAATILIVFNTFSIAPATMLIGLVGLVLLIVGYVQHQGSSGSPAPYRWKQMLVAGILFAVVTVGTAISGSYSAIIDGVIAAVFIVGAFAKFGADQPDN